MCSIGINNLFYSFIPSIFLARTANQLAGKQLRIILQFHQLRLVSLIHTLPVDHRCIYFLIFNIFSKTIFYQLVI